MQDIRGNEISMIFQEPMTSLNPIFTIGSQIAEVLHRHVIWINLKNKTAVDLLDAVKIPDARNRIANYTSNVWRPASTCNDRDCAGMATW